MYEPQPDPDRKPLSRTKRIAMAAGIAILVVNGALIVFILVAHFFEGE